MAHLVAEKQYELPEAGLHNAFVRDIQALGIVASTWEGKQRLNDKIRVHFELEDRDSEGRYVILRRDYNIAMGPKAVLPLLIESILGERKPSMDLDDLIGRPVQLIIIHQPSKSDGKIYANVKEVLPWPSRLEVTQVLDPDYIRVEDRIGYKPPVDTKPVAVKPIDTKAVDTKAVDTKAVDTKAVDTKAAIHAADLISECDVPPPSAGPTYVAGDEEVPF